MHDCGVTRAIGYFLEPLILLGLFARKTLVIILKGKSFFLLEFQIFFTSSVVTFL